MNHLSRFFLGRLPCGATLQHRKDLPRYTRIILQTWGFH
jgi:hypothetical protein